MRNKIVYNWELKRGKREKEELPARATQFLKFAHISECLILYPII